MKIRGKIIMGFALIAAIGLTLSMGNNRWHSRKRASRQSPDRKAKAEVQWGDTFRLTVKPEAGS
jgi:hypothetical protein